MNNQEDRTSLEIQNQEFIKKITDLEFENSLLSQKNKNLEKKLESLTIKYNDLKKELFDIEQHINFCKDNQTKIVDLNQNENNNNQKSINSSNFNAFKNKIKILFEFDDIFLNTDSETDVFNKIIDSISNIKNENLNLRKTLEELKKIVDKKNSNIENNYNLDNNTKIDNQVDITPPINFKNNFYNYQQNSNRLGNNVFNNNEKENSFLKKNYTYDIVSNSDLNYNNLETEYNYDDVEKRCMNSKIYLNDLMKNIDNLQKVFKTDNNYDIPKTTNRKNYVTSLNRPRLYHKYI